MNNEKQFLEIKKAYEDMFENIDLKQFEEIKKQVEHISNLREKIKELANNENKYYIWIIEETLKLLKENNNDWFGYFGGY